MPTLEKNCRINFAVEPKKQTRVFQSTPTYIKPDTIEVFLHVEIRVGGEILMFVIQNE